MVCTFGGMPTVNNFSYLLAVSFYFGLIVLTMVGAAFIFTEAETRQKLPAVAHVSARVIV